MSAIVSMPIDLTRVLSLRLLNHVSAAGVPYLNVLIDQHEIEVK